ncbi:MAG: hypothetical protein WCI04_00675 [archaeon]
MGKIDEWMNREKYGIIFTIAIILIVGLIYFGVEGNTNSMGQTASTNSSIFETLKTKVNYVPEGNIKVFANLNNNSISTLKTLEGNPIPETNTMVIGEMEAEMMKKEKLISKIGDPLNNFFGINTKIEGILKLTNTPLDYMHFLSAEEFGQIQGEENKYYVLIDGADTEPIFRLDINTNLPKNMKLSEGNISDYEEHQIVGKTYYPLILGYDDANEMRQQKEFTNLGDPIEIAGKEFIVMGILEKTNSILDMAHIIPLNKEQFNAEVKE